MNLIALFIFLTVISSTAISANIPPSYKQSVDKDLVLPDDSAETQLGATHPLSTQLTTPAPSQYGFSEENERNIIPGSNINAKQYTDNKEYSAAKRSYQLLSNLIDDSKLTDTIVLLKETKSAIESTDQIIQKTFSELKIIQTLSTFNSNQIPIDLQVRKNTLINNQPDQYNKFATTKNYIYADSQPYAQQISTLFNIDALFTIALIFIIAVALFKLASFILLRNPYN